MTRQHFVLAAALLALTLPGAALAQAAGGPPTFRYTMVAAPDQRAAIQLPMGQAEPDRVEQWFLHNGMMTVHNVTRPTLTPFLPGRGATGAAVIIAPGGGFASLSMENEGWKVAKWLADRGIAAFVLKYRLIRTPAALATFQDEMNQMVRRQKVSFATPTETPSEALVDGLAALAHVRANATRYGIDPSRIGFMGFSAGGNLTRSLIEKSGPAMPAFAAPIYPRMGPLAVPPNAPPLFVTIANDDFLLPATPGFPLIDSWRAAKKPVEFHLLANGGHGFGFGRLGTASEGWLTSFHTWLGTSGFLAPKRN